VVLILATTYIAIWLITSWIMGAYDKPQKLFAATKGIALGTLIILAIYALLPNYLRFSRAIIMLNMGWSIIFVQASHIIIGLYKKDMFTAFKKRKRIAIVGNPQEVGRVQNILDQAGVDFVFVGQISPTNQITESEQIATLNQLDEFVRVNDIDEIIFCSGDISSQEIIKTMLTLVPVGVDYKIAPPDSLSIIGSNSIDTSGDLYTIEIKAISKPANRRSKRFFDMGVALLVILISLLIFFFVKRFLHVYVKAFGVLLGRYTWVSYIQRVSIDGLPKLKRGVYSPLRKVRNDNPNSTVLERINILYAKNYSVLNDLSIFWRNFFK